MNPNDKTTIRLADLGWLLNRVKARDGGDPMKFVRLDREYRAAARLAGHQVEESLPDVGSASEQVVISSEEFFMLTNTIDGMQQGRPSYPWFRQDEVARLVKRVKRHLAAKEAQEVGQRAAQEVVDYLEAKSTQYTVVISDVTGPPVVVTDDKEVAVTAARTFNHSQDIHPGGRAYSAEVYSYAPGGTKAERVPLS